MARAASRSNPPRRLPAVLGSMLPAAVLLAAAGSAASGPGAPAAAPPPGDDPAPPAQEAGQGIAVFGEEVSVSWVLVPVVVRARGRAVEGLDRDDFRLFVDGRRVPVDDVDVGEDVPLSVVYLQDLSGSMANGGKLDASRRAFTALLERFRDGDELALATFAGDRLRIEVPFTGNAETLSEAEDLWEGYGTTALHDAISLLPDISEGGRSGRRVAVLVTDGQDNASALDPVEAVSIVERARLPVYVLGLTARGRSAPAPAGGASGEAYRYRELLAEVAERTGGGYFEAASLEEATEAMVSIVDDLRQRYILSLTTRAGGPRAYRRIRVEATLPYRHEVTFRKGYYGPPPTSAAGSPR